MRCYGCARRSLRNRHARKRRCLQSWRHCRRKAGEPASGQAERPIVSTLGAHGRTAWPDPRRESEDTNAWSAAIRRNPGSQKIEALGGRNITPPAIVPLHNAAAEIPTPTASTIYALTHQAKMRKTPPRATTQGMGGRCATLHRGGYEAAAITAG